LGSTTSNAGSAPTRASEYAAKIAGHLSLLFDWSRQQKDRYFVFMAQSTTMLEKVPLFWVHRAAQRFAAREWLAYALNTY
jgi:hypothetical protein